MNNITIVAVFVCGVAPLLMCGGIDWAEAPATCAMLVFARLLELFQRSVANHADSEYNCRRTFRRVERVLHYLT